MKRILIFLGILVSLTAAHFVFAQTSEGVVVYEVKVNMHRRLPPERQGMKEMMPEFDVHREQLFFTATESRYKTRIEKEEKKKPNEKVGGIISNRVINTK